MDRNLNLSTAIYICDLSLWRCFTSRQGFSRKLQGALRRSQCAYTEDVRCAQRNSGSMRCITSYASRAEFILLHHSLRSRRMQRVCLVLFFVIDHQKTNGKKATKVCMPCLINSISLNTGHYSICLVLVTVIGLLSLLPNNTHEVLQLLENFVD